jgi:tetratricopeptide (TPR) repeat protein
VTGETNLTEAAAEFDRASSAMRAGRWDEALAGYDAVLRLAPGHVPSLNNRGIVLSRLGRHAEALASLDAALAANPVDPIALNNRGEELQRLMRAEEALASYDAAIARAPGFAPAHANRGHLLGQLGRTSEAVEALTRAIGIQPGAPRYYQHLAPLRRFTADDPILAQMRALAGQAQALPVDGRIELGFALAKALADIGEHDQAFAQLAAANRLKRSSFHYDEAALLSELDRTGVLFGEAFQSAMSGAGDPGPAPILIVGMPRSGSTLVEQILASHPGVFAAGENTDLDEALDEILQRHGAGAFPDGAARLSPGAVRDLGAAYLRRLSARGPVGARIVDKTLSNFRYLGLLHAALPGARIIHVRRDPVDACMSCYGLLFGGGQPYAYDLAELGRYYRACEGLMRRWREPLGPEVVLDVRYEALVSDLEGEVRRLLRHCGLDWDPRCLEFHRTERQVRTSSASQVRRPLYASAVGASQAFAPHLSALLDALGPEAG